MILAPRFRVCIYYFIENLCLIVSIKYHFTFWYLIKDCQVQPCIGLFCLPQENRETAWNPWIPYLLNRLEKEDLLLKLDCAQVLMLFFKQHLLISLLLFLFFLSCLFVCFFLFLHIYYYCFWDLNWLCFLVPKWICLYRNDMNYKLWAVLVTTYTMDAWSPFKEPLLCTFHFDKGLQHRKMMKIFTDIIEIIFLDL